MKDAILLCADSELRRCVRIAGMYGTPCHAKTNCREAREQGELPHAQVMVAAGSSVPMETLAQSVSTIAPTGLQWPLYLWLRIGWQTARGRLCFGDLCHLARRLVREASLRAYRGRPAAYPRFDGLPSGFAPRRLELLLAMLPRIERDCGFLYYGNLFLRDRRAMALRCSSGNFS